MFGLGTVVTGHSPFDNNNLSATTCAMLFLSQALTLINGGPCPGEAHTVKADEFACFGMEIDGSKQHLEGEL